MSSRPLISARSIHTSGPMVSVLIHTFGSRGDVQPYVALGAALQKRGVDVTITTAQGFDDLIEGAGLTSRPCSVDIKALIDSPEIREAMRSFRGKIRAFKLRKTEFDRQFDEQMAIARDVRPDLMIVHPKGLAAVPIGEKLGIPVIPTTLQPAFFEPTGAFPHFLLPFGDLGPTVNRLSHRMFNALVRWGQRQALKTWAPKALGKPASAVPPFSDGFDPAGRPVPRLFGYSGHIVPKPDDWPATDHVTGYWFTEPDPAWRPPEDLAAFLEAGPPPVYVGFGSMPVDDPAAMTRAVIEALKTAGARGILATGWGGLAAGDVPDSIHVLKSAPHDWLFPRCAAVVHHGGAGTTHEGLRWGRPSLVCPFIVDQPFWGRRLARLGVGPDPLPLKKLDAGRLAAAISQTLDPAMAARAEALGHKIRAEDGAARAAALVAEFLGVKTPIEAARRIG